MFIHAVESMGKITQGTMVAQQEMFKKWFSLFPALPTCLPANAEQVEGFQKRWSETATDLLRRQREVTEAQFKAGLQNIDRAFAVGEAKNPEEVRARAIELWQKCFDSLRVTCEAQIRETQVAGEKWFELLSAPFPPTDVPC